jgi:hypothetical protein
MFLLDMFPMFSQISRNFGAEYALNDYISIILLFDGPKVINIHVLLENFMVTDVPKCLNWQLQIWQGMIYSVWRISSGLC